MVRIHSRKEDWKIKSSIVNALILSIAHDYVMIKRNARHGNYKGLREFYVKDASEKVFALYKVCNDAEYFVGSMGIAITHHRAELERMPNYA